MSRAFLLLGCFGGLLMSLGCGCSPAPVQPTGPSANEVALELNMLDDPDYTRKLEKLAAMGERVFPALEGILDGETDAKPIVVSRVFLVLQMMKCDRSRFLGRAVARLGGKDNAMPLEAAEFLGSAGGEAEAVLLEPLLLDPRSDVRYAAAKAIAAIGGQRQLDVFDQIIQQFDRSQPDNHPIQNRYDIAKFEKCRDQLKARLAK